MLVPGLSFEIEFPLSGRQGVNHHHNPLETDISRFACFAINL